MSFVSVANTAVVLNGSMTATREPKVNIEKSKKSNAVHHSRFVETTYIPLVSTSLLTLSVSSAQICVSDQKVID